MEIEGQLNATERKILMDAVANGRPETVLEVGTYLGGGSTIHLLKALHANGKGHLWGIEADKSIYERMTANIKAAAPEAYDRFTPVFGFSQNVIPEWLKEHTRADIVFLDGGNNPMEQITEFELLAPFIPVGGELFSHDVKLRKGKWLRPYMERLDNWETKFHDVSDEGLFYGKKIAPKPSAASLKAARSKLFRMKLEPSELAAIILPHSVRAAVLKMLPRGLSRRLSDGR